ncbi:hypothetical protein [Soonwooa sp.]|uniref:hypothetical protein n=1 Tax=Soonwooa sp. TaxID=1938592 RepID=UPI002602BEB1|nr:hypothetical protein [Soonwooa sp.]
MRERANLIIAYLLLIANIIAFIFEIKIVADDGGFHGYAYILAAVLLFIHPTVIPALITILKKDKRNSQWLLVFNIAAILYIFVLSQIFIKI